MPLDEAYCIAAMSTIMNGLLIEFQTNLISDYLAIDMLDETFRSKRK